MRRLVATALLLACGACAPPRVVYRHPADALARETSTVMVRTRGGTELRVRETHVQGDSLIATNDASPWDVHGDVRLAVLDVATITRTEPGLDGVSASGISLLVGVIAGGFLMLGVLMIGLAD